MAGSMSPERVPPTSPSSGVRPSRYHRVTRPNGRSGTHFPGGSDYVGLFAGDFAVVGDKQHNGAGPVESVALRDAGDELIGSA
jgi:hypothetical protein